MINLLSVFESRRQPFYVLLPHERIGSASHILHVGYHIVTLVKAVTAEFAFLNLPIYSLFKTSKLQHSVRNFPFSSN